MTINRTPEEERRLSELRHEAQERQRQAAYAQTHEGIREANIAAQETQWKRDARAVFVGSDADFTQAWPDLLEEIRKQHALDTVRADRRALQRRVGF